jgi:hypothetical protein
MRWLMQRCSVRSRGSFGPAELAEQFGGLLWGNLMISLLLGVAERPNSREVAARARDATAGFLQLNATMSR